MTKVVCVHPDLLPQHLEAGVEYFSIYRSSGRELVSTAGTEPV